VGDQHHGLRVDRLVEARPTAAGVELRAAAEQLVAACLAAVQAVTVLVEQGAGPRALGGGTAQDRERGVVQQVAPLGVGSLDLVVHRWPLLDRRACRPYRGTLDLAR